MLAVGARDVPRVATFAEVPLGACGAIVDSEGYVALVVNQGSAAQMLGLSVGDARGARRVTPGRRPLRASARARGAVSPRPVPDTAGPGPPIVNCAIAAIAMSDEEHDERDLRERAHVRRLAARPVPGRERRGR